MPVLAKPLPRALLSGIAALGLAALGACSTDIGATCPGTGGLTPERPTPRSIQSSGTVPLLEVGDSVRIRAAIEGGCSAVPRNASLRVDSGAALVNVQRLGSTNEFQVRALQRGRVVARLVVDGDTAVATVWTFEVQPRLVTALEVSTPSAAGVDTLLPNGTVRATATARDRNRQPVATARVNWLSLTPSVATIDTTGTIRAVAPGRAFLRASVATRPELGGDSLRTDFFVDVVSGLCNRQQNVVVSGPTTLDGTWTSAECTGVFNFPVFRRFSLAPSSQLYVSMRLTWTGSRSGLVPINLGASFYGVQPADTAAPTYVVFRPAATGERFGFGVFNAVNPANGTYRLLITPNPDPSETCGGTQAMRGVEFATALFTASGTRPSCTARTIRLLPPIGEIAGDELTVTASAVGFAVTVEIRDAADGALLASASTTGPGASATVRFTSPAFRFADVRVVGPPTANGSVNVRIQ